MEEENLLKLSSVIIIVLGDIGHSPRMCNHAYSFASKNINVDLIGYLNSKPHENICKNKKIRIHSMSQPPSAFSSRILFIRLLMLPLKFIWMFFTTLLTVTAILNKSKKNKNSLMLVQNPPGLPTMFVCYLITKFYKMLYVVDWHNYTFSMLRMSILFEPLEGLMGRLSDLNICVSRAMQNDLKYRWGIKATVFYDRPPDYLFKFEKEEKCQFLRRFILDPLITAAILESKIFETEIQEGLFMQNLPSGEINEKRPFLLISSTSWTPDEDFSILLNALKYYDNYCNSKTLHFPKIFVIITGKGPQKEMYLEKIKNTKWINVFILTAWLDAEDYPRLLSCADIGVCLHTSTTGLDLPMKIVDMFGCHLPVLAKKFNAITELVEDGVNGILFDTDKELSDALIKLTGDFPKNELLNQIHNNFSDGISSWEENWEVILGPLFGITN